MNVVTNGAADVSTVESDARKKVLIAEIAEALRDMDRHQHGHIEAQKRVVRLRAEYDDIAAAERQMAREALR
ncbi:hypothetical protein [Mycobacterium sp. D16R24]|uniref:hypothetical protein n=1 Tax=Mycobacterium sp. D16R24 TaxID=1855656 RepID=UPI000992ED18|nr:hypothetical protein [Mycobacterium sp. D16R24]